MVFGNPQDFQSFDFTSSLQPLFWCERNLRHEADISSGGAISNKVRATPDQLQKINMAVGLFRGWLTSENLPNTFENFTPSMLTEVLEQFYTNFKSMHAGPFNVNKLSDVREGVFSYLSGISDAWKSYLSQPAYLQRSLKILESLKQHNQKTNTIKQKVLIKVPMTKDDVRRLMNSGVFDTSTPLGLFRKVWFDLTIHLGVGGQAAMRSLTFDSFVTEADEQGRRYYRLNRAGVDKQQARSCMEMQYWNWDGRMYEISGDPRCPVKSMDLYYERRNRHRDSFFQRPKQSVTHMDSSWFESPVGHSVLACLMTKMSEEGKLQRAYSNSSVRITVADLLEMGGYDVEELLGGNPRNKTSRGYRGISRNLTSDQLYEHSNVIHTAIYSYVEEDDA